MKKHIPACIALSLLILVAAACSGSFTTANISSFNFGKTESAEPAVTAFDITDMIYAVATVSNTSSKHKITFKVFYENVTEKGKGEEALKKDIEFEGARPITLNFKVPLPGEYRIEAILLGEDGKEVDKKSGSVTVTGKNSPAPSDRQAAEYEGVEDK